MNRFTFTFQGKTLDQIKEFANAAARTDGGVTICYGKNHFDGSSFMSLIALKNCDLLVAIYSKEETEFENFMIDNYLKNLPVFHNNLNYMKNIDNLKKI